MGKFYSLKDFVHEQGLNMGEFSRLDKETQEKWREIHQRKLKEKLAERDENIFRHLFLADVRHVNPDTFDDLAQWKQEEWRKQYAQWKKDEQRRMQRERMPKEQRDRLAAYDVLRECGVPFGPDDSPLGI